MKINISTIGQYIYLILFIMLFSNCEKLEDITEQVVFFEISSYGVCFWGYDADYDELVITDNKSYQAFGDSIRLPPDNLNCDTTVLPYIDFDKYSLIGKHTSGGGCEANYERQIVDYKRSEKIIYKITVEYSSDCYMLITSMNLALIPNINKNYTVEFQVEYIK